ncbi:neural cell adhesion molecule 2-like [Sceloporus undulatus]|uniref:neural cell adhesion molecule 2-like n=1 Tax=Sceloporus undulatus TaxID=8520 RepID=UPI001C4D7252|nr:neural cell adhesion molecule 2-like [Sceloporus undulatus]
MPVDELSKGLEMTLSDTQKAGIFTCKGEFETGGTATAQIRINVIQKPTFVTKIEPVKDVHEGTSVSLNCQAAGIPPPTVRWIFENQDLSTIEDGRIAVEHGILAIKETRPTDAGVYTCEARIEERNEVVSVNVSLNVKFTPRIELPTDQSFVTQIGNPTQLNFTILANPSPVVSISWKGKVFEDADIKKMAESQDRYLYFFEFTPASQEDISELFITAANELGSTEKTVALQEEKGLGTGSILAIVLAILLVILLVVDASCYYKRRRGLLMYCRNNILDKKSSRTSAENNGKMLSKSGKSTVVNVSGIEA